MGVSGQELFPVAKVLRDLLGLGEIAIVAKGLRDEATLVVDGRLRAGGYRLTVSKTGVSIHARNVRAAFHAVQTIRQLAAQSPRGTLVHVAINDWPDIPDRAIYYDVARGRVPKLERLKELAEKSDPVRLVPLFDRVLDQAPIYFEWLETEYENQDEQITEYYVGGARGFAFAMENFRSAVFLVIMNRLDIASRVISELDE